MPTVRTPTHPVAGAAGVAGVAGVTGVAGMAAGATSRTTQTEAATPFTATMSGAAAFPAGIGAEHAAPPLSRAGPRTASTGRGNSVGLSGLLDAARDRWNALIATAGFQRWSARFPLTRPVSLRRSRALFDLCAGFVYTQTLLACIELDLFDLLADGAKSADALAQRAGLSDDAMDRLLKAAVSLTLLVRRRDGRIALGPLGAPLVHNAGLRALVLHHRMVYDDLRDPIALLQTHGARGTELAQYWPYADPTVLPTLDDARVASYSTMMSSTLPPLAEDVIDACALGDASHVNDIGGGEGVFLGRVAARHPGARLTLLDLPSVAARARARLDAHGVGARAECIGINFHEDELPRGGDVYTLIRVLLDHDDAAVARLLRRIRTALAPGARLVIAEAMAGARGAEAVGDAYFGFYLLAMGKGRARTPEELHAMLRDAGFSRSREVRSRYPVQAGIIVADA